MDVFIWNHLFTRWTSTKTVRHWYAVLLSHGIDWSYAANELSVWRVAVCVILVGSLPAIGWTLHCHCDTQNICNGTRSIDLHFLSLWPEIILITIRQQTNDKINGFVICQDMCRIFWKFSCRSHAQVSSEHFYQILSLLQFSIPYLLPSTRSR